MGLNSLLGFLGSDKAYRRLYKQIIINYHKGFNVAPPEPEKLAKINAKAGNLTRQSIKNFPPLKPFIKTNFPVIVTYGDADAYGDSKKYLLQRFPETTPVIIPRCGHTPWKHQPDFFFNIVKNFYHMSGR
jgi:proline iminopeptidase